MKIIIPILIGMSLGLSACASISEEDCQVGAWSEYGYKDGLKGRSSSRVEDYAQKCAKFGIVPDMDAYLTRYDQGIQRYCTYERGFERGRDGGSYNQACSGSLSVDYAPGYDEGRLIYEIREEYDNLIDDYEDSREALIEVERKLIEDELSDDDRRRLEKKARRLEGRLVDLRVDIRAFERQHNFPRYRY